MPSSVAARTEAAAISGCSRSVTSSMVPPVCRFAVRRTRMRSPLGGTSSIAQPDAATTSAVVSSSGMRDSPPVARSRRRLVDRTSSATGCRPSPTTSAGRRTAAATTCRSITMTRRSSPGDQLLDQHVGAELQGVGDRPLETGLVA